MRNPAFSVNAMVPLMQCMDWDNPTANPNNWQKELGNKVMGEFPHLVKDAGAGLRSIQLVALQLVGWGERNANPNIWEKELENKVI